MSLSRFTAAGFALGMALWGGSAGAAPTCTFLQPVGGNGISPIVSKSVGRGKLIGKTNWNTDFFVTQPYTSFKFFVPVQGSGCSPRTLALLIP